MPDRLYFAVPEYDTIGIGSLVWYYYLCGLYGPLHVVEIRHAGYGNGAHKQWILFDTSKNEYFTAKWDQLRIPKECIKEE